MNRSWLLFCGFVLLFFVAVKLISRGINDKPHLMARQQFEKVKNIPVGMTREEFLQAISLNVIKTEKTGRCVALDLKVDPYYSGDYSMGIVIYIDPSTDRVVGKMFADGNEGNLFVKGYEDCYPWKSPTSMDLQPLTQKKK